MMKYKSLFIDLDDTLWDTYHNNKECLEEVYTAHHFDRYYATARHRGFSENQESCLMHTTGCGNNTETMK